VEEEIDNNRPPDFHPESSEWPRMLNFEEFRDDIGTHGGFLQSVELSAKAPAEFEQELVLVVMVKSRLNTKCC
jgi:hypothetical protein